MAEAPGLPSGFRFGPFEVDLRANEVRKNGLRVRLQEQPFRILALLLRRPGEVVTREELRGTLWPADTYVGFDHGLNNAINRLREALGDSADRPRFVETLPRVGYRFIAPIERLAVAGSGAVTNAGGPRRFSAILLTSQGRAWLFGLAGLAFALFALSLPPVRWLILGRPPEPALDTPFAPQKHVAVLPFGVVGDQASLGHIAVGIAEDLSRRLTRVRELTVTLPAAVESAAAEKPFDRVARDLGVNLIASGTIQGGSERLLVVVNLDDIPAKRRIWREEFSAKSSDLLALEEQVFAGLLRALGIAVSQEEQTAIAAQRMTDIDAYDLYLRGRDAMRGQQDVRNVKTAIHFYEAALARDPRFALAWTGLADSSLQMYRETKDSLWAAKALSWAQQAQRIDATLAEVHFALGNVYVETGKVAEAVDALRRGLELTPSSDEGHRRLGSAYLGMGRVDEALRAYRRAIEINPYYWRNHNALGAALMQLGQYESAAQANLKVIELEPENVNGYNDLGGAYLQLGRFKDAASVLQKALTVLPNPETYTNLGIAYSLSGNLEQAVPMFEKAVELRPSAEMLVGNLADGYRWSGQSEKASAAYDRAIALAHKELQVNPHNALTMTNLALYHTKKGGDQTARSLIAEARKLDPANVNIVYSEAVIHAWGKRFPEALRTLREALKMGYSFPMADADIDLKPLREDPRYWEMKKQLGITSENRHSSEKDSIPVAR